MASWDGDEKQKKEKRKGNEREMWKLTTKVSFFFALDKGYMCLFYFIK
jgi:hypothetical protein